MDDVLALVDGAAGGRVVVFGAPPPDGRDLDLLIRPTEERRLRAALLDAGFRVLGGRYVRFRDCTVDVVELVPAARWQLGHSALDELFEQASPLDAKRHLALPSPHHRLLIAARKLVWGGGRIDPRRLDRVEALLAEASTLAEARRRAPGWNATTALAALERAARDGGRAPRAEVARAVAELAAAARVRVPWLSAARAALPRRPRRGTLITFSGLDGSGKSSQAAALREALERLGYEAVVEWSSLSQHPPLLHAITGAAKKLLRGRSPEPAGPTSSPAEPTAALRERSAAVNFGWSVLVALTNAVIQARAVNRHLWRGRIVVCDRYALDSRVHLRYAYGEQRRFAVETWLIRHLSPRPDRAYFLDVSPETATRRKADYPLTENARRARLYREEQRRFGAVVLDGERPYEETCASVAQDVASLLAD